jgi:hypothetical protein
MKRALQMNRSSTGSCCFYMDRVLLLGVGGMPGKIFLNYRRSDADAWADRVYDRLVAQFPHGDVFMDIDGKIPLGLPWTTWLDSQVAKCDLMLVLIGRTWVAEFQERSATGERDYVRVEIESALARKIPVVPVLLGDAPIPSPADLPMSIRPLLDLHATRLQRTSFEADAKLLIDGAVRSIKLARGDTIETSELPSAPTSTQYRAEGHINAPQTLSGAPGGWSELNRRRMLLGGTVATAAAAAGVASLVPGMPIWRLINDQSLRTLKGRSYIQRVAVTPDGRQVVSGGRDGLKVWDLASGSEVRTLSGHTDTVLSVAVTRDGRLIVSGSKDKTIKLWELATGRELRTLTGHTSDVESVTVTPDGHQIVSGSWDNTIKVWGLVG